jgi:nucleoid-associated protein YgaU
LASRPSNRSERRRELGKAVLAVLGLLVVLIGIPAALVLTVGNPLPTTAPSREWLTAQVTTETVLRVLACALWLAWAHFAACVLAEWKAARRGSGLPSDIPLGGGSQVLARKLVAAALLLAGAAALVPAGTATTSGPALARSELSISATVLAEAAAPAVQAETAATAAVASGPAKSYVVQPPDGRRYDSLWDISERTLGDPFRYKEIFELNRAKVQDDGRKLIDANLIHPGWVLAMPADASGPGVTTPAVAPPQRSAPAAPAVPAAPAAALDTTADVTGTSAETVVADAATAGGLSAERMLLGGGLLAAGVLVALSARRGPYARPAAGGVEEQLRLAATPGRAELLDRALRTLASSCAATGLPLPEIAVAYCDDSSITLSLIGAPGTPPAPWTAVSDGRGWSVRAEDLPTETPDVAAPYPALAGIAVSGGADVLVDLEAAPGLLALDGDPVVAREVAVSLVVELATNLWSDGVDVTAIGFGDDLSAAAPQAVTSADALADVLSELEAQARAGLDALRALGVDGVLSGRLVRDAERRRPRVVVLSGPPTPQEADRLQALVADVRTPLAVVCVGATPAARWRFTAEADGTLDLGVLGLRATARRLPREGYLPLLELLRGADHDRSTVTAGLASLSPRAALQEVTGAGSTAPLSAAPAAGRAVELPRGLAAVDVRLLGPVEVVASGPVEPASRALLTELVVAAALHRDGLHEAVLRAEVWPRGVSDDVLAASVGQAQTWLGAAPDGRPRLRRDAQGLFTLYEDVHCDWDVLRACAAAADGPREAAILEHGLSRISGQAFSGTPRDRFTSMVFHRAARDARVVGTAVARRAAGLASGRSDRPAAERALRAGLLLVPTAEPLWRDLLRLVGDEPARAHEVAEQAHAALAAAGLHAEPETDALVQHLAPGRAAVAVGSA